MNIRNLRMGFTLIEILVVISIVGILSSIMYVGFSDARQSSQNKTLTAELKEVQLALEVYKAQNGQYPDALTTGGAGCSRSFAGIESAQSDGCSTTPYIVGLMPEFIAKLPSHTESANTNCNIVYQVEASNKSWYKLTAVECFAGATTAAEGIKPDDAVARCPSYCGTCDGEIYNASYIATAPFYESMAVFSAGGECK